MKAVKLAAGLALTTLLLSGGVAYAQTSTGTTDSGVQTADSGTTSVPGAPNTGTGGDATTTALLIGVAALVALGGIAYLARNTSSTS